MQNREHIGIPDKAILFICRRGGMLCAVPGDVLDKKYKATAGIRCSLMTSDGMQAVARLSWSSDGDWETSEAQKKEPMPPDILALFKDVMDKLSDDGLCFIDESATISIIRIADNK
jgi:hypothetical protein